MGSARAALAAALMAAASPALALTVVTDTYTLSGDTMGGTFSSVTASGDYGYRYVSNGKTYRFGDLTVNEEVSGYSFTYGFSYDCLSITPHCGTEPVYSQFPGGGSFAVQLTIDSYALMGARSVVPTSFTDFLFDSSGSGTLSYQQTVSSAPEPGDWVLMLGGTAITATAMRRRRRAPAVS